MFNSILVICTGNICRSPFAERILRNKLPNMRVDSAGTGALVDSAADSTAMRIAKSFDVSLDGHKGKQFSAKLGREYDLILVMERAHITQISSIAPEVRGKLCSRIIRLIKRIFLILTEKVMKLSNQFLI